MGGLLRFITYIIVIMVVYRLLDKHLFSLFRPSRPQDDQMRAMQEQLKAMNEKLDKSNKKNKNRKEGDFIDYEELK
jgi:hypothetical protein